MKRLSVILTGILVLLSSIIFCACNDGFKGLEISCEEEEISLVLDDEEFNKAEIIFEINKAKKWGEVSVSSQPQGLIMVEDIIIKDAQCGVRIKALQPSGDGAQLVFTHLGSNQTVSVPLKIGRKLVNLNATGKSFIIEPNNNIEDEEAKGENFDIPTKLLLSGTPENYTNNIAWNLADGQSLPAGITLISYSKDGDEVNAFSNSGSEVSNKIQGSSSAVKTVVNIANDFNGTEKIVLNPISILGENAVLHKDVEVVVYITKLLTADKIVVDSVTHKNKEGDVLGEIVLINNPNKLRETGTPYNYYSTAILNLKLLNEEGTVNIPNNSVYRDLYTMHATSDIQNLSVEDVSFDCVRITALTSCAGSGNLTIKFSPKEAVGDIQEFSLNVPVVVGEKASSVLATVNREAISINKIDEQNFESVSPLYDSNSIGQAFQFKMLSENTLEGLKKYKITIDRKLLYIATEYLDVGRCDFVLNSDKTLYDLSGHIGYTSQIAIMKNNRQMIFYPSEDAGLLVFESEEISEKDTLYIKYVITGSTEEASSFGISIKNYYDGRYDLENSGFDKTAITYKLNFNRQRAVESVDCAPASMRTESGIDFEPILKGNFDENWTYYFTPQNLESENRYYGLNITEVLGLNKSILTPTELNEINLTVEISGGNGNLGWSKYNESEIKFKSKNIFNFETSADGHVNFLIFGKTNEDDLAYGNYQLTIKQGSTLIVTKTITIYENLRAEDIKISVPNAEYLGSNYKEYFEGYYKYFSDNEIEAKNLYVLAINKAYNIQIQNNNKNLIQNPAISGLASVVDDLGNTSEFGLSCNYDDKDLKFVTGVSGSFNAEAGKQNFVKVVYTIKMLNYDYYKPFDANNDANYTVITNEIYIYIYEPLTSAGFVDELGNLKTNFQKYNFDDLKYTPYVDEESYQTLKIRLNSETVYDYVKITWKDGGDGISEINYIDETNYYQNKTKVKFKFDGANETYLNGMIIAYIKQFGMEIPIYCQYVVRKPVLTEKVSITNDMNSFYSGSPYISLKVGEELQIQAKATSTKGDVSLKGFSYAVCSVNGYATNGVASVDKNGKLTALNSGKIKLIVVATDRLKANLQSVVNYFKFTQYVDNSAYAMVDVLVADGSKDFPYLISSKSDFENIQNDFEKVAGSNVKVNNKYYALVQDVDLNGQDIIINGEFVGSIFSYQEDVNSKNRFSIYGVRIFENHPSVFSKIGANQNGDANFENINIHITFDYTASSANNNLNLGFIDENSGTIKNCQFYVGGIVNASDIINSYTIGTVCAKNLGVIVLDNEDLVGVQGSITVQNSTKSQIVIGGLVGENSGKIQGVLKAIDINSTEVDYQVFYGTQGAMADIELQVKGVDDAKSEYSAIGGVVGLNKGKILGVYSLGKVLGIDDKNALIVDNVGGIIGKNEQDVKKISSSLIVENVSGLAGVSVISYDGVDSDNWQIFNSYSTAKVYGRNNVGGVTGLDYKGEYNKVYYEIYDNSTACIKGKNNVGGLIGNATDTNLYYCYANSFVWDYTSVVANYDIWAESCAGGLIGYGKSTLSNYETIDTKNGLFIVSSASSLSVNSQGVASGIIGISVGKSAIYTAYFYGVITATEVNEIAKVVNVDNTPIINRIYNNLYVILGETTKIELISNVDLFGQDDQYNNGKLYIKYGEGNLITVIPTIIEINKSFEEYNGIYKDNENKNALYKVNIAGEYVLDAGEFKEYDDARDIGKTRYALMGQLIDEINDPACTNSDYRAKIFMLYCYQFNSLNGEQSLMDMQSLNSVSIRSLLIDAGIVVKPNTSKRFNVSSSDKSVITPASNGMLILKREGQVTITITSVLNNSASASFVVVVKNKVLKFGLYSSPNCLQEYDVNNQTLSVVKNTSKLLYANYDASVKVGLNEYSYQSITDTEIYFNIEVKKELLGGKEISEYITINGDIDSSTDFEKQINGESVMFKRDVYIVKYGTPIAVNVKEHFENGEFKIVANSYIVVDYVSDLTEYSTVKKLPLTNNFVKEFYITTKKGPTAINTDKTEIQMMPADDVELEVKISTDIKVDCVNLLAQAYGDKFEFDINGSVVKTADLLEIYYNGAKITSGNLDITELPFDAKNNLQVFKLKFKIAELGYYLNEQYKLDLKISVGEISSVVKIIVKPQEISNIMVLNYRLSSNPNAEIKLDEASLSNIIRPGSKNVLVINISPNIAVYEYLEIIDLTLGDKVLFMQVNKNLKPMGEMDKWIDDGIKLIKETQETSTIYAYAMLPLMAQSNQTHTLRITAYDKTGKQLMYKDVYLEAVLFPSITLTYEYPNGQKVEVDSRMSFNNEYELPVDLAVGVEASINVETNNIDEDSLAYDVKIKDNLGNVLSNDYLTFKLEDDKYVLRFNYKKDIKNLIGSTISVSFSASKQVNGVNETCKSTINFVIRKFVVHSVSMSHITSDNRLYGFWDKEFSTEFYFDKTDISYYNGTDYWNTQYKLSNLQGASEGIENSIKNILEKLNTLKTTGVTIKFGESVNFGNATILTASYNENGIKIRNVNNKFMIIAEENSNINNMKLGIEFYLKFDNANNHILASEDDYSSKVSNGYEFYVEKQASPFDEYKTISNQKEFEQMLEGNYYQLINDIQLTDYYPISTAIAGFNGNGKVITINNFALEQLALDYASGGANIGLFGTIDEQTAIQNVWVKYKNSQAQTGEVNINFTDRTFDNNALSNSVNIGGIAGVNLGVITNCYVEGGLKFTAPQIIPTNVAVGGIVGLNGDDSSTKLATITSCTSSINISGMANVGGITKRNNGKISTTIFEGKITNKGDSVYASTILTSGFVVENSANGTIKLSAVLSSGISGNRDIDSYGTVAGFVCSNQGEIQDCYVSEISLEAQGSVGGFVYENNGTLTRCYSNPNLTESRFYDRFIYQTSNYGTLTNCYVITDETKFITVQGLSKISKSEKGDISKYENYVFASTKYGVWALSDGKVVLENIGFNETDDYSLVFNIYDEVTFEGFTKQIIDNTIQNRKFNIVRDIDLSTLTDNPITYDKIFSAQLEGNGLTISGYSIYNSGNVKQIGLFAQIKQNNNNDMYIRNLILQPESVKASKTEMVGSLAGMIDGGYLYNIQIDAGNVLILGRNAVGGLAGLIKGNFEIVGIKSNISAFSSYVYGIGNQYNLYLSRFGGGSVNSNNIEDVSYAGSVAGIVDGYKNVSAEMENRNSSNYCTIENVEINGDIVVIAETVGGAFGLIAENSSISNVRYNLEISSKYQSVYVAGGLVGENRGVIKNSYISNANANNCFNGYGRLNGGIVGLNIGGLIDNCTADIYMFTTVELSTVGGIVGRNIEGTVNNCSIYGRLHSYFTGGIIGTDYTYRTIEKLENEYGTATISTSKVYKNVRLSVNYEGINEKYSGNKIGGSLINSLINNQYSYYTINNSYTGNLNNLVTTKLVYGLVVGLTDRNFAIDSVELDKTNKQDLMVNLKLNADSSRENCYIQDGEIKKYEDDEDVNEENINIAPIKVFDNTNFDRINTQKFVLLYLIASESATYEYWSTALNYCNEYVAVRY